MEWREGDMVRNPRNDWTWRIEAIQNGWARLVDKNGFPHMRTLQELSASFEKI